MMQKRTMRGWFEYLDDVKRELDLSEFMALMLMNTREYTRLAMESGEQARQAAEHTEGMLGALDLFAAEMAARAGVPYAASGKLREALDTLRDERRRPAAFGRPGAGRPQDGSGDVGPA